MDTSEVRRNIEPSQLQEVMDPTGTQVPVKDDCESDGTVMEKGMNYFPRYNMSNKRRGKLIIICNIAFDNLNPLDGCKYEAKKLKDAFEKLRFNVVIKENQTADQMLKLAQDAGRENHGDADCFAMAVLSHGGKGGRICGTNWIKRPDGTISGYVTIDQLTSPIEACTNLQDKPKLFIIDTCRGSAYDAGVFVTDSADCDTDVIKSQPPLRCGADIICCFSTTPDYVSYSPPGDGSPFIKALCEVLKEGRDTWDMHRILLEANSRVAYGYGGTSYKMMPSFESSLTRDLFFPVPEKS